MTAVPRILLIHGAWHDAASWDPLIDRLRRLDPRLAAASEPVELPGRDRAPGDQTLAGHAEVLRARIAESQRPTLLVAHSYGGAAATEALADGTRADRLLFVAAFALAPGESCMGANDAEAGSASGEDSFIRDGEHLIMPAEAACDAFYQDLSEAEARRWASRLLPEHTRTVHAAVGDDLWRRVPHGYVLCTRDRAILPQIQRRMAAGADAVHQLDAGHCPMLSRPEELARILQREAAKTGRASLVGVSPG